QGRYNWQEIQSGRAFGSRASGAGQVLCFWCGESRSRRVRISGVGIMDTSDEAQYVTFSLGEEVFAVPVGVVREILDHEEAFKIPNGPDYLLGLRDVRGQGVPVM